MTKGDGTAIDVEFLLVDLQFAYALQDLDSESLVQFDQIDIFDVESGALQDLARSRDRTKAHVGGVNPCPCRCHTATTRAETQPLGVARGWHDQCTAARLSAG